MHRYRFFLLFTLLPVCLFLAGCDASDPSDEGGPFTIEFDQTISGTDEAPTSLTFNVTGYPAPYVIEGTFSATGKVSDSGSFRTEYTVLSPTQDVEEVTGVLTLKGKKGEILLNEAGTLDWETFGGRFSMQGAFNVKSGTQEYVALSGGGTSSLTGNVVAGNGSAQLDGKASKGIIYAVGTFKATGAIEDTGTIEETITLRGPMTVSPVPVVAERVVKGQKGTFTIQSRASLTPGNAAVFALGGTFDLSNGSGSYAGLTGQGTLSGAVDMGKLPPSGKVVYTGEASF